MTTTGRGSDETLTRGGRSAAPRRHEVSQLYRIFDAGRPLEGGARHELQEVARVEVGRGDRTGVDRGPERLGIALADRAVSSRHARLTRVTGRWLLEDLGSKNGTFLNGARVREAILGDGDLVEIGHTFFLFRAAEPPEDGDEGESPLRGLPTLVPAFARELARLAAAATADVPILIGGESGTGKELVARAVHQRSARAGRFVAVNCGALPETLVEAELLGARRGAFSGAVEDRPGLVRASDRGTLFLDEIADLPLASQASLLRVLQEREVLAIGATQPTPVDLRVVAATNHDLEQRVAAGRFRADLRARLAGFCLNLPPLRERRGDLGLLVAALLSRLGAPADVSLSCEAARALVLYDWPMNVRELEMCLRSALALAPRGQIDLAHLPEAVRNRPAAARPRRERELSDEERRRRDELVALLEQHGGNVSAVARATGRARVQIQRWLKRFGLATVPFRKDR